MAGYFFTSLFWTLYLGRNLLPPLIQLSYYGGPPASTELSATDSRATVFSHLGPLDFWENRPRKKSLSRVNGEPQRERGDPGSTFLPLPPFLPHLLTLHTRFLFSLSPRRRAALLLHISLAIGFAPLDSANHGTVRWRVSFRAVPFTASILGRRGLSIDPPTPTH